MRAEVSGLLESESYECETCTVAQMPDAQGRVVSLANERGCTGIVGLAPNERLADALQRPDGDVPRPLKILPASPTYPDGWVTIAAEASSMGIKELSQMLGSLPQYESRPIHRCIKLLVFDSFAAGWLQLYASIKSGMMAPPQWLPPFYTGLMSAISGAISSHERAMHAEARRESHSKSNR